MRVLSSLVVSACVVGMFGCGGSTSTPKPPTTPTTPTPSSSNCTFSIAVSESTINASGGTGTATVTTGPQCRWSANAGTASWLTIPPTAITGPGTVPITADPNRSFTSRPAAIQLIDDAAAVLASRDVLQRAATCLYSVEPTTLTRDWLGTSDGSDLGLFIVRVHAEPSDCSWTATPNVPWIIITPLGRRSGTGDGFVDVAILHNSASSSTRVGDLVVAGLSGLNPDAHLVVTQTGR